MDAVLVYTLIDSGLWEGHHEGRRCWRDTYSESYITKYTSMRRSYHVCLDWKTRAFPKRCIEWTFGVLRGQIGYSRVSRKTGWYMLGYLEKEMPTPTARGRSI